MLEKATVIDIGSNSLRLMTGKKNNGQWEFGLKQLETTRLGADLPQTGILSPVGVESSLAVFERWSAELVGRPVYAIATSAVREARDGQAFMTAIAQRFGWHSRIISGKEEAALSFLGAASAAPAGRSVLVLDIGGGSTETALGMDGQVIWSHSYPMGAVRFSTGRTINREELSALQAKCQNLWLPLPEEPTTVIGVGGTLTSLAAMDQEMETYDPDKINGYTISTEQVSIQVEKIFALPVAQRRTIKGLQPKRGDIILAGLVIAQTFLQRFHLKKIQISERDLMEGFFLAEAFQEAPYSV